MTLDRDPNSETSDLKRDAAWLVRALPLFQGLDDALLDAIVNEIEWFALPGGTTLFEAGDPPDALYLVVSGSLGAYAQSPEGHRRLVGRVMAGEAAGEMALISGKPRTATLIALRDTELGRLSSAVFEQLMLSHPQGLLGLSRLMVQRLVSSQRQPRGRRPIPKTLAIAPHDGRVDAQGFAAKLATCLAQIGRAELVSAQRGAEHTSEWFHAIERTNDFVVYVCDAAPTSWSKLCFRQADVLLLLALAEEEATEWPMLVDQQRATALRTELVILHDERITRNATATLARSQARTASSPGAGVERYCARRAIAHGQGSRRRLVGRRRAWIRPYRRPAGDAGSRRRDRRHRRHQHRRRHRRGIRAGMGSPGDADAPAAQLRGHEPA